MNFVTIGNLYCSILHVVSTWSTQQISQHEAMGSIQFQQNTLPLQYLGILIRDLIYSQ